jgi:hypothetical protein
MRVFPADMVQWEKTIASWFIPFALESAILISAVNVKYFDDQEWIPELMAFCSGAVILLFYKAFDFSAPTIDIITRWFLGLYIAGISYMLAKLFAKKWTELEEYNAQQKAKTFEELSSDSVRLSTLVDQLSKKVEEQAKELVRLRKLELQYLRELTCEHCHEAQPSFNLLRSHKGNCKMNPRNSNN